MYPVPGKRRGCLSSEDRLSIRQTKDKSGRKRYAVEFEVRGHRVFRRLPAGATKEQATELETRLRHELIDQTVIGKRPNVLLTAAIRSWLSEVVEGRKSETQTTSHANAVIAAVEGRDLADIADCAQLIRDAVAARRGEAGLAACMSGGGHRGQGEVDRPLSPATKNRRLCILKAVAKFAWRKGWAEENLSGKIQLLPEKKYQRREVTPEDAQSLIAHANTPRAKALIALSAYTGLRLGEVLKLRPEDVKGGVIVARDTKNGTDRIIPILPELEPHLSQLPFTAGWRNVYRGFESARKRAGLDIRYHDLRHMVASALARSGADLRLSMDLMGHRSVETHRRYVHTDMEAKREALSKAFRPSKSHQAKKKATKKAA